MTDIPTDVRTGPDGPETVLWARIFEALEIEPVTLHLQDGEMLVIDRSAIVGIFMRSGDDDIGSMTGVLVRNIGRIAATDIALEDSCRSAL